PTATASPWFSPSLAPAYPCADSIAWPKVWPKFSRARSPRSYGSRATTSALYWQDSAIARASASLSRASSAAAWSSSQSRNPASKIAPYLTTSARPARSAGSDRVAGGTCGVLQAGVGERPGQPSAVACEQRRGMGLEPGEDLGIEDRPVLGLVGQARAQLAVGQGVQGGGVGKHRARGMERA